jgi:hypothetical protein
MSLKRLRLTREPLNKSSLTEAFCSVHPSSSAVCAPIALGADRASTRALRMQLGFAARALRHASVVASYLMAPRCMYVMFCSRRL